MTALTSMMNIGKEMERKLNAIGITSAEVLMTMGSKDAFVQLKLHYPNVCTVHLYTLEGAIGGIKYNQLPDTKKQELQTFYENLK